MAASLVLLASVFGCGDEEADSPSPANKLTGAVAGGKGGAPDAGASPKHFTAGKKAAASPAGASDDERRDSLEGDSDSRHATRTERVNSALERILEQVTPSPSGDGKRRADGKLEEILAQARREGVQVTDGRGKSDADEAAVIDRVLEQLAGKAP